MDYIRQYLLSVICASILVSIITAFLGEKSHQSGIFKLITGVFIIFTVISPVVNVQIQEFQDYFKGISENAQRTVQQGELMSQKSTQSIIKDKLEAYILDKASSLNLDLDISITLKDEAVATPEEIIISGNASPYGKKMLQTFLVNEIGIPEEKQLWR